MENDIDIQEVSKSTTLREQRLRKVKNNIEAMQKKMNNKNTSSKGDPYRNYIPKQIISVESKKYRQEQSQQNTAGFSNYQREFEFNSNLFKHVGSENQQILQNGSAVSNFSSVSNINNILNGNTAKEASKVPLQSSNSIIQDIDKILQKVNKTSSKMPVKAFGKYLDIRQQKQKNQLNYQGLDNSVISQKSGEVSARSKLLQYKKFIAELQPIQEFNRVENKSQFSIENQMPAISPFIKEKAPLKQISLPKFHKKSGLSNFSLKSQLTVSENNYLRFPPTPPAQHKKQSANPVDRQKAIIKQTMHQYKKLQTQKNSQMFDRSIDFELSDEESQNRNLTQQNQSRIEELLHEKTVLQQELLLIQSQLSELQNQD